LRISGPKQIVAIILAEMPYSLIPLLQAVEAAEEKRAAPVM